MNPIRPSLAFILGALVTGALGIAAPRNDAAVDVAAKESITIHAGDTLAWHYSINTDTVLGVVSRLDASGKLVSFIVARRCGTSKTYARPWKLRPATHDSIALAGDSITVKVTAPCTVEAPVPVPTPTPTPPPVVIPPTPAPVDTSSLAEPVFDATKATMLLSQNFDTYALDSLRPKDCTKEPTGANRIIDHDWYYECAKGGDPGVQLVPGRSGLAASFHYQGISQESHGIVTPANTFATTGRATVYLQYWAKWTSDAPGSFATTYDGTHGSAIAQIKNVMLWHGNNRLQFDTHSHSGSCSAYGPSYTMIAVLDSLQLGCESDSPVGPYMISYADGQWHRWTIQFRPGTSVGSRDGVARLWIDGKLTNNLERGACGITPPGGWKPWCDVSELDGIAGSSANGINSLEWGGPLTGGDFAFSIAIDEVKFWRIN